MAAGQGTPVALVADLMSDTLARYKRNRWTDLMSALQKTIAFKEIYRPKKTMDEDSGGTSINFQLLTDTNGSFRFVGLAYTAVLSPPSADLQGSIPWRGWTYNWWFDAAEPAINAGDARIIDIMRTRYYKAVGSMIEGVEAQLWRLTAATDDTAIYGIPNYVVKSATVATDANNFGFNGLAPSGYTTVAGINPTTYERWRNYTDTYSVVSKDDLIRKLRRAAEYTKFMPLVPGEPLLDAGGGYGWYMNYITYGALVEAAEGQNDDLGEDVASMDGGKVMFRGAKLDWNPMLREDTTNPVYGIDWSTMYAAKMPGWWEKETKIDINPQQPTVVSAHTTTRTNLICTNRRANCVISNGTTLPA